MRTSRLLLLVFSLSVAFAVGSPMGGAASAVPWVGFDDVPPTNTFYSDIMWLRDQGITRGCNPPGNTLFCPDEPVTRGQMAAFLTRALGLTDPGHGDWFDDDDDSIFRGDIDRIAAAGITAGCNPPDNTMFCPDGPVTRQQMATFLVRALGLTAGAGIDWFGDDDRSVHQGNIDRLRAAGITFGCNPPTENRFCPTEAVTRAQMAAFLHRALDEPAEAALAVHARTWPDPLYLFDDMTATFEVRNAGLAALSEVTLAAFEEPGYGPVGDCQDPTHVAGPVERLGNGDTSFDPGELWEWYCAQRGYFEWGYMKMEATAVGPGATHVSATGRVDYSALDPLSATVTVSSQSVAPGTVVTWTVDFTNPSGLRVYHEQVEGRLNRSGGYSPLAGPFEVTGNGDDVFDPGERTRYTFTTAIWVTSSLDVSTGYAPVWSPGTHTGLRVPEVTVTVVPGT